MSDVPEHIPRGKSANDSEIPPPLKDYRYRDSSMHLIVAFNKGRDQAYEQCIKEVNYFCDQIDVKGEGTEYLFEISLGEIVISTTPSSKRLALNIWAILFMTCYLLP